VIYVRNTTRKYALPLRRIQRTTRALLTATGRPESSLSLTFVGDAAMRRLNREHRGYDRSTDVLSFPFYAPFRVPTTPRADDAELLLGDIVISVDAAARQARAYDATLEAEITRLLVHGVAHLLGHDHEQPRERVRMLQQEKKLAAAVGLVWPYP